MAKADAGLRAGAAQVEITPAPGVELMGYGARQGTATGVHDPLFGRALYLEAGPGRILIVSADLCLMAPTQADALRERIRARCAVELAGILIACSHTHSGPDTGIAAHLAARPEPAFVSAIFDGLVLAAERAVQSAEPARLRLLTAEAWIGRNRRIADGPLDPAVSILDVQHRDGRPLAVWFQHACHGTVLGHDNLELSADWAGVTADRIAQQTGAVAGFMLGAHADIDPRTRGLMDLAIPGQSVGLGFEAVRVLGEEVAAAVLDAMASGAEARSDVTIGAAHERVELPVWLGKDADAAQSELAERKRELATRLYIDVADFPRLAGLGGVAAELAQRLPLAEARSLLSEVRRYLRDKTAPFFAGGGRHVDVEAQVLRIGDAVLLGLPVEPTTQVGLDWKRRVRERFPNASVVGIANGWLRYLPHADDLSHPRAHEHYEVLESILAPGACERLLATGERLAERL